MEQAGSSRQTDVAMCLRIIDAVDQSLDVMSVNEICANAGISRQTFYNHFQSKYSLAAWWSRYCEGFYLDKIGFEYSWEEGYLRHIQLLASRKTFLCHALASKEELPYLGTAEVAQHRTQVLENAVKARGVELDFCMRHAIDCFTNQESYYTYQLFRKNSPEDIRTIPVTQRALTIVPAILYEALQLPGCMGDGQVSNIRDLEKVALRIFDEGFLPPV